MPIAFAVLRLITHSNLVDRMDRQIGRPVALENPPGIDATLSKSIRNVVAVADQAAIGGKLAKRVDRGQRHGAPPGRRFVCAGWSAKHRCRRRVHRHARDEGRKCRIDVTRGTGLQHDELQPENSRGLLHRGHPCHGIRDVLVDEERDDGRLGNDFMQQRELLGRQIDPEKARPGDVSPPAG